MQSAAEVAQRFDGLIQTCILTFLSTARPHPVSAEADAIQAFFERCPKDVRQRLSDGEDATGSGVGKSGLGRMAESRGDTFHATIVEGNHATVAQRQLQFALTLLTSHLARHGAVHLVRQPVLAGNGLKAEDPF